MGRIIAPLRRAAVVSAIVVAAVICAAALTPGTNGQTMFAPGQPSNRDNADAKQAPPPNVSPSIAVGSASASAVAGRYIAPLVSEKMKVEVPAPTQEPASSGEPSSRDRIADTLRRHELIRTGSFSLLVADVERALTGARAIASAEAGDVTALDDQRPASTNDDRIATVTLAVPNDRFDAAMEQLTTLGGIRSRTVTAQDVGDRIVDVGARLRNLRRAESDLLRIMDRSGRIGEILDVENQLTSVRESIERLDAENADLQHRVAYATIDVTVRAATTIPMAEPSTATLLASAWHAALHRVRDVSLTLAARIFVIIAFIPYWLGAALLLSIAIRSVHRRFARPYRV
ncbi:MAG: DUF4349 domain-containing protein [Candidatus Eremiobacteraeota bacterium]|nr:DUF4349 domain-containing protein [Candidatus Eremiobacteraeota bacterium]